LHKKPLTSASALFHCERQGGSTVEGGIRCPVGVDLGEINIEAEGGLIRCCQHIDTFKCLESIPEVSKQQLTNNEIHEVMKRFYFVNINKLCIICTENEALLV
jgi:hypothetical protein